MNLLVIAPHYNYFVKGQIDILSRYFDKIYVFVKYNPLVEIFSRIPISYADYLKNFTKYRVINLENTPNNIEIKIVSMLYLLPDSRATKLGDLLAEKISKIIQKEKIKFDIIHAHFVYHYGYAGAKLKEKYDIPLIVTAHGDDVYDFPFRSKSWMNKIKWVLDKADHIITVSRSNQEILIKRLGISKNKISLIPNGFNARLFYPIDKIQVRRKLGLPLNKKVILNVANLIPIKGQKYLIEAIEGVARYRKDVLCTIVGDGMLKKDLENQIKKLNLENYVKLVGAKPHSEIPLWMNAADLFVLPSLSEGNPTVMFEALGVGLPFVGTAVGGVPEIITSEDYGLLCPPADPECLAEKILIALDKEWDREKIRKYAEQFTWERIAKQTLEVYKKLLG